MRMKTSHQVQPDQTTHIVTYEGHTRGLIEKRTDPAGRELICEYVPGSAERVAKVRHVSQQQNDTLVEYSSYTTNHRPLHITLMDAAGNKTHWNYDVLGRVTEKWLKWDPANPLLLQH
jgi:YD repeat-containing protein